MKTRFPLLALLAAVFCAGFSGAEDPARLRGLLKRSGDAQLEAIRNDSAMRKWENAFSGLLEERERSGFYKRLDTATAQCLWLIETFGPATRAYTATELQFRDSTTGRWSFHDRTANDTADDMTVYYIYHAPLHGKLTNTDMDRAFPKIAAPFTAIPNRSRWNYPDTVPLSKCYPYGKRRVSRKIKESHRESYRASIAGTLVLYTMIQDGEAHTSVQLPPDVMPFILLHMRHCPVCF